jgi:hypothetical protein
MVQGKASSRRFIEQLVDRMHVTVTFKPERSPGKAAAIGNLPSS